MKKNLFLLIILLTAATFVFAQSYPDNIYGIRATNSGTSIIKMGFHPNTGAYSGSYSTVRNINYSVALAYAPNGYFYYIDGDYGEGDGKFDLYAVKADGSTSFRVVNNFDANGSSDDELGFVRLGSTKSGLLVIISKNEGNNKIYATTVQTKPDGTVQSPVNKGELTTSDNSNKNFKNGDLVIDANDMIYVLANNDGTQTTGIYKISVADLSGSKILTKSWTLLDQSGNKFTNRVNGVAWSSTGSLFISDDEDVYFVDQNTVNTAGPGTVKAKKVSKSPDGLTDLASIYCPEETNLPVVWGSVSAKTAGNNIVVNFTTETETNNDHFELLGSNDGNNFVKIAEVKSKATNGNSSTAINYEITIPISGKVALGFSVLGLLGFGLIPNKKKRLTAGVIAFIIATLFACSKNSDSINTDSETNYKFVKVVQVDKDGKTYASKVISVKN